MALKRMDNVGIVVESLDAALSFFAELGLELEGRATIEGEWAGRVTGLRDQRVEIAMMRTPDGHSRLELSRFLTPPAVADHRRAPVKRSRLPTRHVHRGGHRRYARPAPQVRRAARRRSGPVQRRVSALLHPGPRRTSHRSRPRTRLSADDLDRSRWLYGYRRMIASPLHRALRRTCRHLSVLSFDHEERAADRACELRLLLRQLEARRELGRDLHPVGELEADGSLLLVVERVQHVDRQPALVEHVRPADVLDLKLRRLERAGLDDEVALLLQGALHPRDGLL